MKPYKSFLFLVTVLAILFVLPLLFPEGKIPVAGLELRIYSLQHLSRNRTIPERNSRGIFSPENRDLQRKAIHREPEEPGGKDTVSASKTMNRPSGESLSSDTEMLIPEEVQDAWNDLRTRLLKVGEGTKPLRVLYYGDSQIENDRITSVFRNELQAKYGGTGRGLVPVENIYNTANNLILIPSDNWETDAVISSAREPLDLGFLCKAFRIIHTRNREDSLTSSWIKIKTLHDQTAGGYSVVSLYYRASGRSRVSLAMNNRHPVVQELQGNAVKELRIHLGQTPEILDLQFTTNGEITLYGLTLESPAGIMVDNIALRGMAYPGWSAMDTSRLKQMASLVDPALVILHFGINVVPYIASDYRYYKDYLTRELDVISRILPDIPVLMVSVSDMARKTEGLLASYPNLELILRVQKEAALEKGCAFWNLYEAMGGEGSMIQWVERQPPLGNTDYVHFTPLGADYVGSLLANQFMKTLEPQHPSASLADEY